MNYATRRLRRLRSRASSILLLLHRVPNVRFIFSHNGALFPFITDRISVQHQNDIIMEQYNGLNLREILQQKTIYFDIAISRPYQYDVVWALGMPTERLLYGTDFPYTKQHDTASYLDGYNGPKESGSFNDEKYLQENFVETFPSIAEKVCKTCLCRTKRR